LNCFLKSRIKPILSFKGIVAKHKPQQAQMPISDSIPASPEDSLQIARVHIESTTNSTISKIASGTSDPEERIKYLAITFGADIQRPFTRYFVVKDTETKNIVSYVKWVIPPL
jgi:hypothetical protein